MALFPFLTPQSERFKKMNPPIVVHPTEADARKAADEEAKKVGGKVYRTGGTGSMRPTIVGRPYTVAVKKPYDEIKEGEIGTYRPKWANGQIVVHRFIQKDKDGWIMGGDNNKTYENWERVKPDNYHDTVTAIHTYVGADKEPVVKWKK
jgi:hypothetical protein